LNVIDEIRSFMKLPLQAHRSASSNTNDTSSTNNTASASTSTSTSSGSANINDSYEKEARWCLKEILKHVNVEKKVCFCFVLFF